MRTILLVEDEALIALGEAQILTKHNFNVITAYNGERAIEIAGEQSIDLILMDIDLGAGRMDGTRAAQIILEKHDIPVVFLSSHTEPEIVEKTEKITSYGYVVKNSGETVLITSLKMAFKLYDAKKEVQSGKRMLQSIFDNAFTGIAIHELVTDSSGQPSDYIFLDVNNAFGRYTGLNSADIIGRRVTDILPGIEKSSFIQTYGEVVSTGRSVNFEEYSKPLDRYYAINAYKIDENKFATIFMDISDRKTLTEKEYLLFQTQKLANLGSWTLDLVANRLYWTDEVYHICGLDPNTFEPEYDAFLRLIHPDDRTMVDNAYRESVEHGKDGYEITHRIIRKDTGDIRFVREKCYHHKDEEGRITSSTGMVQDITEHTGLVKAAREREDLLAAIEEAQELFISGHDSSVVYQNMLHLLVKTTGSSYGFLDEVRHDDDGTPYKVSLAMSDISWDEESKRLYEELRAHRLEFRNLHNLAGALVLEKRIIIANDIARNPLSGGTPQGHPPLKTYLGIPLYYGEEIIGVAGVANNPEGYTMEVAEKITPLTGACAAMIWAGKSLQREKETLEALRKSEQQYRTMAETANEGILAMDADGNTTYVNKHLAEMLGYTPDELKHIRFDDLVHPDEREKHKHRMYARREGHKETYELRFIRKDGSVVWTIISETALFNENEEFSGFFAMIVDITDRKEAEETTHSLLREKEILLKDTHHRVKNNMSIIESMLKLGAQKSEGTTARALKDAQSRVHGMTLLYEKMYTSKLTGSISIKNYLPPLARDIISMFPHPRPYLDDTGVDDFELNVKTLTTLGLIMNELVTNTMKYAFEDEPGTITLAAHRTNGTISLFYSHDGSGIPDDVAVQTFGVDAVKTSRKAPEQSVVEKSGGFGLQLVKMLTDQLDGNIRLDLRGGMAFSFEFEVSVT